MPDQYAERDGDGNRGRRYEGEKNEEETEAERETGGQAESGRNNVSKREQGYGKIKQEQALDRKRGRRKAISGRKIIP